MREGQTTLSSETTGDTYKDLRSIRARSADKTATINYLTGGERREATPARDQIE